MNRVRDAVASYLHITDVWLTLIWLFTSSLSVLFLAGLKHSGLIEGNGKMLTQIAAIGLGLAVAVIVSRMDYNSIAGLWKLYVPVAWALVLATFIWGTKIGGDQAWLLFQVGGATFSLQPSELLKISFILTFSLHISKAEEHLNSLRTIFLLCLHGGIHVLVIHLQDSGTALTFLYIFLIMIFFAGISWKYILAAAGAFVVIAPILWFKVLTEYQKMRILIVRDLEQDPDYAYQQIRGLIAMGSGGIQGTGIFNGQHVSVPKAHNDFIFSFIAESTGFMGSMGVILLLLIIMMKILYDSSRAKDTTGRMICVGVFAMLLGQTAINLGMCLGISPVIGVTLPLLSQGGTSVVALYLGLGLVLSVYGHSKTALFADR